MSTHTVTASLHIPADPMAVYAAYTDVARWSQWDPDTRAAALLGPPAPGTWGWLKPAKGLKVKLQVVQAVPGRCFTLVSPVLGSRMTFEHMIEPQADGVQVTHRVTFSGWLAPWLMRAVGRPLQHQLPVTLQGLRQYLATGAAGHS